MANGSEKVVQMLRDRWQQYLQVVYIIFCLYDHRKSKSPPGYKAPPQSNSQQRSRVCTPAEMILFGRSVDLISLYPLSSHALQYSLITWHCIYPINPWTCVKMVVFVNKVYIFNRKYPQLLIKQLHPSLFVLKWSSDSAGNYFSFF